MLTSSLINSKDKEEASISRLSKNEGDDEGRSTIEKRRLLFVISNADLGGAQRNLLSILRKAHHDFETLCVYGDAGPAVNEIEALGVTHRHLLGLGRGGGIWGGVRAAKSLRQVIQTFKPDLIHAHSSKAGLISRIVGKLTGVPVIYTAHGWGFKPGVPIVRRYAVWLSEFCCVWLSARLIVVSEYDYALAQKWLPGARKRMVLVRNGIPDATGKHTASKDEPIVVMVARFREPKRQDLLLRAFSCASAKAELWLIGDGPDRRSLELLSSELGKTPGVKFLGDRSDVEDLLNKADIFVLISNYEGLPISILEAMRAGLPVVASRVGGIPEEVVNGSTGFLVENTKIRIQEALDKLLVNHQLRLEMGAAGRSRFLEFFQEAEMLDRTYKVYDQVLPAGNGERRFPDSFLSA